MKKFFLYLLIINLTISECTKGCLKCNKKDICEICDFVNFYKLEKNSCIEFVIPNCEIIDFEGNCIQCFSNFYLDADNKNCLQVTTLIENCKIYSSQTQCLRCALNYYLKEDRCYLSGVLIDNCEIYKEEAECHECAHKYILAEKGKKCVLGEAEQHCQFYAKTFCKNCVKDYIKNYSINSKLIFNFETDAQKKSLFNYMRDVYYGRSMIRFGQVCRKIEVSNCMFHKSYNQCYFCELGYYLNPDEKCIRYPIPQTTNCQFYNPIYQCQECENGFMIEGDDKPLTRETMMEDLASGVGKTCVPNEPIDSCLFYDGTKNTTLCKECESDYYLQNNKCIKRNYSTNILNCLENSIEKDTCEKCIESHILSSDKIKCFPEISECNNYSKNSSSSDEVICKGCKEKYFLKTSRSCMLGSIANCKIYVTESNCKECEDKFYLKAGKCIESVDIEFCENYSKIENDKCTFCNSHYFNFKVNQTCLAGTEIENCQDYMGTQKEQCIKCKIGFFLENNSCKTIEKTNCLEIENGSCKACSENFGLDFKSFEPTCENLPSSISQNCEKNSLENEINYEDLRESKCLACNERSVPIDHREQFMCIENSRLHLFDLTLDDLVEDCIKYDFDKNCIQCGNNKYLTPDLKCDEKCAANSIGNYYKLQLGASSTNNFIIKGYNICVTDQTDFCEVVGINQNSEYICLKCYPDHMNVIDFSLEYFSLIDGWAEKLPFINAPVSRFPEVTCTNIENNLVGTINDSSTNSLIENCKYYKEISTTSNKKNFGCIRCEFGFTGTVNNKGYIGSCVKDNSCKVDYLYGLDLIWEGLSSCHICESLIKIPFIIMKSASISDPTPNQFLKYSFKSLNWKNEPDDLKNNIECLEPVKTSFGYPDDNLLFNFPENCGLGFVNLLYTTGDASKNAETTSDSNPEKLALYCAACKPKFRATELSFAHPFVKVQCEEIENCLASEWFNYCSKCDSGHVFEWTEAKINYDKCILNPIPNCFAATNEGKSICRACKKGYNLNQDFHCVQYQPPNCESTSDFNLKTNYFAHPFYSYYHNQNGLGCNKCRGGFTAVEVSPTRRNTFICTESSYLAQNKSNLDDDTKFIPKCLNYSIENNLLYCSKCELGYIFLDKNGERKCYFAPKNCIKLESATNCEKCEPGFALVNKRCEEGNISNCLDYNSETNRDSQLCKKCKPEYYKSIEGNCEAGLIRNCEKLLDFIPNKCLKCLEGFFLVKKTKVDYCYPIPEKINCKKVSVTSNIKYGGELTCLECKNPFNYKTSDPSLIGISTSCFSFTKVEHCKVYDYVPELLDSTFFCKECESGYYLELNIQVCKPREYNDPNCEIFFPIIDKCQKCSINTMQTYEGYCEDLPSGINGCIQYSEKVECINCNKDRYLEDGECKVVNVLIENCRFYYGQGNCKTCMDKYFLTNNECLLAIAKNCKTYTDIATCNECEETRGLVLDSNGNLNCDEIKKPNCKKFKQLENFPCEICNQNYFPDGNGDCQSVKILISGCDEYETDLKCKKCKKDMALKEDGSVCSTILSITSDYDINCEESLEKYKCSMCRPGAFFQGEQCVLCFNSDKCFRCDPENPKTCLLCNPGYFMDKDGKCNYNANAIQKSENIDGNEEGTEESSCRINLVGFYLIFNVLF